MSLLAQAINMEELSCTLSDRELMKLAIVSGTQCWQSCSCSFCFGSAPCQHPRTRQGLQSAEWALIPFEAAESSRSLKM